MNHLETAGRSENEIYPVLWPLGNRTDKVIEFAERLDDLNGKVIAEVWSWMWSGDLAFSVVRKKLTALYPDIKFISYKEFGNIHGPDENQVIAQLPEKLRFHGADAVVLGIANCGSCTPAVLRAHVACEAAGFPSVSIVGQPFIDQAKAVAEYEGITGAAMSVYPGNIESDSETTFEKKCADKLPNSIVEGLTTLSSSNVSDSKAFRSGDIAFQGTLDEVIDHFDKSDWSDGLPIIPPTPQRVQEFLNFTARESDEVLGILLPAQQQATIRNIAITGVMAGCKPEYMPLLIASVEVLCDPRFRLEDQGSSPAWEILCIVSGPIATQLDFNHAHGVCSTGRRANTSIGRFLRLYSRNIAGHRIPPGVTDYAGIGNSFVVAITENEDCIREIGWTSYAQDQGFNNDDNAVTLQSIVAASPSFLYAGPDDGNVPAYIEPLKEVFGDAMCGYWGFTGATYGHWHPLIILNPDMARIIAKAGWDKTMLRDYLYRQCRIPARIMEKRGDLMNLDLAMQVRNGVLPDTYLQSDDPERLVPVFIRPEWISIIVAGAPTTFFRGYMNNHEQGIPITRKVVLPTDWSNQLGHLPANHETSI